MTAYFSRLGLLITLLFITNSCENKVEREPPVTPLSMLNEFVDTAPYQYLNLDNTEVFEIVLVEEDIIFDVNEEVSSDDLILGQISNFTYGENGFYVFERNHESIFMIDLDGGVTGPVSVQD